MTTRDDKQNRETGTRAAVEADRDVDGAETGSSFRELSPDLEPERPRTRYMGDKPHVVNGTCSLDDRHRWLVAIMPPKGKRKQPSIRISHGYWDSRRELWRWGKANIFVSLPELQELLNLARAAGTIASGEKGSLYAPLDIEPIREVQDKTRDKS